MSLLTDLRAISENAIEQIAARFSDLPGPLLFAIGAGDMAVERWADLRESLADSLGDRVSASSFDRQDVRSAVADLPARAQQAAADLPARAQQVAAELPARAQQLAADVAASLEQLATDAPVKAQALIGRLPGRLAEFQIVAETLSPDALRETVDAYTQLMSLIYRNLADRGDKAWSKVAPTVLHPGATDGATRTPGRSARSETAKAAEKRAATARAAAATAAARAPRAEVMRTAKPPAGSAATETPATRRTRARRVATPPGVPTPVTVGSATRKPRGSKPGAANAAATPKPTAAPATPKSTNAPATPKPAAAPATPKSTNAPATPKSTAKPATPRSTAKPRTPKSTARPAGPGVDHI